MPEPLLLGVEIGGTKLQVGLGDGLGRIAALERLAIDPARGSSGIRDQILAASRAAMARLGVGPGGPGAVGIGFGGPVDAARGRTRTSHQVAGWDDFPLADWAREHLGVASVALENDADAAALGEARFGAGVGASPLLYVTIGSGIGGGLVVDGRIYRGSGVAAVEVGHLRVDDPADPDGEGRALERVASGWAIDAAGRRAAAGSPGGTLAGLAGGDPGRVTAALVSEAARRGDPEARAILVEATRALGRCLASAVTLLAPRRVILGGGVSLIGEDLWYGPIRRELDRRAFPGLLGAFEVVAPALGEEVVVHGALALARDALGGGPR